MKTGIPVMSLSLLFIVLITFRFSSFCGGTAAATCVENERQSLLRFKQDVVEDHFNRLASWIPGGDCCKWADVVCNNITGHVIELHLGNDYADMEVSGAHEGSIWMGEGKIHESFGELCNLRVIALSNVNLSQDISQLLDIFSGCISDGLESLDLSHNRIYGKLNDQLGQFKHLHSLVLSGNSISGVIPMSVGELSSLTILRLFNNRLEGPIPSSLGNLSNLRHLDLSSNRLNGSIPSSVGKLVHLTRLELSDNSLSGPVPFSFGELSSLVRLDVSSNKLNGTLSEIHFTNHTNLTYFLAQGNSLGLEVDANWIPPFQLEVLYLGSCQLGPMFPLWVLTQKNLGYLDISSSGIEGNLPRRFWSFASQLLVVNISHNQICGEIPNLTEAPFRASLDFSWNRFSGPLPRVSNNVTRLDFSNNGLLSGTVSRFLCDQRDGTKSLVILNLRSNSLSGEIPDCWARWGLLEAVYLENNKFTGHFPPSIGSLTNLQSLHLRRNNFSGTLPASLGNCSGLVSLDASENRFSGNIPSWVGESFPSMLLLNLHSNELFGPLPRQLCHLDALQILDLASNNLSGTIPGCFGNFSAMATVDYSTGNSIYHFVDFTGGVMEDAILMYKGGGKEFDRTLNLVRIMDLSDNSFSGEIPEELTQLKALQSLNLSHNHLGGNLPEKMGIMSSLEVIDFSANQLSGRIPSGFSGFNFLSYLNLSDNRLTGQIPRSTQMQSFNASSYAGNRLCGPPLSRCTVPAPDDDGTRGNHDNDDDDDDDEHESELKWFSISIALGFVVGLCGFITPLCFSRRWSHRYNLLLDHIVNKMCCFLK